MAAGYDVRCSGCRMWGPSHPGVHNSDLTASDRDLLMGDQDIGGPGYEGYINKVLSSGRLSAAQIQAASISNVMTLFESPTGSKAEFAHFLQRFILDGFLRGVDVVKIMESGQRDWQIFIDEIGGSAIGEAQGRTGVSDRGVVRFDEEFWTSGQTYEKKLQLFYHEMGHAALARPHDDDGIMEQGVNGKLGLEKNYIQLVNELFAETQRGAGTASVKPGSAIPAAPFKDGGTANPGAGVPSTGGSGSGAVVPPPVVITPPSPPPAVPPTISVGNMPMPIGGGVGQMLQNNGNYTRNSGMDVNPALISFGNIATPDPTIKLNIFDKALKDLKAIKVGA